MNIRALHSIEMLHHIEIKRTETLAVNSTVFLIGPTFFTIFIAVFLGLLFSFCLFLNVALNKVKFYFCLFVCFTICLLVTFAMYGEN